MDMRQSKRDIVTYSLLWIFSIFLYFVLIPSQIILRNSWSGDVDFTSQTFPKLLAISLFVVSSLGILQTMRKIMRFRTENCGAGEEGCKNKSTLYVKMAPLITFLMCILYVFLFGKLGFVISSAIVTPLLLVLFKCRKWTYYVSVYVFAACLYIVFRMILKVPLP